jgi:hypothetical protein
MRRKVLEEAMAPKVESMINKKLSEIEDEVNESDDTNESTDLATGKQAGKQRMNHSATNMEEELESILQELGMDDSVNESDELEEGEDIDENSELDENEDGSEDDEAPNMGAEPDGDADDFGGEDEDASGLEGGEEQEQDVVDLTVDELKSIITSVVQDVISGGAGAGDQMGADGDMDSPEAGLEAPEDGMGQPGDEEVDLDELLAGLEESEDTNESTEVDESAELDESDDTNESADKDLKENWYKAKTKGKIKGVASKGKPKISESGSLTKPLNRNAKNIAPGKGKVSESGSLTKPLNRNAKNIAPGKGKVSETADSKELKEAVRVITTLRRTLNETNLLNAKLLYVNKIFKAKSLNESQKVKVISAFDKASTKEEAKMIFESLNETLNTRKPIRESVGFASKATGTSKVAPNNKKLILEDATVTRFKRLAGITNGE